MFEAVRRFLANVAGATEHEAELVPFRGRYAMALCDKLSTNALAQARWVNGNRREVDP